MNLYGDEAFLIESLSSGNREAFEYVFKKYYQRLVSFAGRYIQNEDIVEDIVQDCYAVLWEKCSTVASISISVSAFLFAMVRNSCLNYLRHEQVIQNMKLSIWLTRKEKKDFIMLISDWRSSINSFMRSYKRRLPKLWNLCPNAVVKFLL